VAGEFNVSGAWDASQGNGWHVRFDLQQTVEQGTNNRTVLSGSAFASHPSVSQSMSGTGSGRVTAGAAVAGDQFQFTVNWGGENPVQARYNGTFGFDRRITGFNFNTANPSVQTTWVSDKAFNAHPT
jgi:hypothetical protein